MQSCEATAGPGAAHAGQRPTPRWALPLHAHEAWILVWCLRRHIERLFTLWKPPDTLDASPGTQPARVPAELYATFIGLLIHHWLLLAGCRQQAGRSLTKAAKVVRAWAERLMRALSMPGGWST